MEKEILQKILLRILRCKLDLSPNIWRRISLEGDFAVSVPLDERKQFGHVHDMWVQTHDTLHHALRVEGAKLAPQIPSLLTGGCLGSTDQFSIRGTTLPPVALGQAVALSVGERVLEILLI